MNLVNIYFDGLKKYLSKLNTEDIRQTGIRFFVHDRDAHVVERAIQRKIDFVELLREMRNIIDKNLCLIIYHVYSGEHNLVIRTSAGHCVFRCFKSSARDGFVLKICTITPLGYRHDRDLIIG